MAKLPPPPKPKPKDFDKSSEWFYKMSEWFEDQGRIASAQLYMQRAQYHQELETIERFVTTRPQRLKAVSAANSVQYGGPHSRACGFAPHHHGSACHENCPTCHGKSSDQLDQEREAALHAMAARVAQLFYMKQRAQSPLKDTLPHWRDLDRKESYIIDLRESIRAAQGPVEA